MTMVRQIAAACTLASVALLAGCGVRAPSRIETAVATQVKHRVTVGGKKVNNPLPPTDANVRTGREAFSHYCVACHGLDGQNTGVPFAENMSPPPPRLTSPEVQAYTDGQLKWVIDHGLYPSGMPASKGILNDDEMWAIVVYLRHLPPKGSLGEPAMYSGNGPEVETEPAGSASNHRQLPQP